MAGPFCTMILADMGAEVVKLERPGKGDSVRAWGDGSERNAYFPTTNPTKKGATSGAETRPPLHQPQQEGRHARLQAARGQGAVPEARGRHRRAGRELPADRHAARRPRLSPAVRR